MLRKVNCIMSVFKNRTARLKIIPAEPENYFNDRTSLLLKIGRKLIAQNTIIAGISNVHGTAIAEDIVGDSAW